MTLQKATNVFTSMALRSNSTCKVNFGIARYDTSKKKRMTGDVHGYVRASDKISEEAAVIVQQRLASALCLWFATMCRTCVAVT